MNDHPKFSWASYSGNNPGLAKVCVGGESFWIRDVAPMESDKFSGRIDNNLVCTDEHGLCYDQEVTFTPFMPKI